MKAYRLATVAILIVLSLALTLGVSAQSGPSLQINNGDVISITRGERPQIVLQVGGGQSGLEDAGVLCLATGDLIISRASGGVFRSFSIAPQQLGAFASKALSFPSAFSYLGIEDRFVDLRPGQNYNVNFTIRSTSGQGGQVLCALVDGAQVAAAAVSLGLGPTNLTDPAVVDLIQQVALSADAVTVNIRR